MTPKKTAKSQAKITPEQGEKIIEILTQILAEISTIRAATIRATQWPDAGLPPTGALK